MALREWLAIPETLRSIVSQNQRIYLQNERIIKNQETLMAQNARVLVLTERLAAQNAAEAQLANAALIDNANLRKTVADLRTELEENSVATDSLDALEAAIGEGGKTAEALVKLADKTQATPPVTSLPDPTPLPGAEPVETLPVPDVSEEAPGVPTPGGESTPEAEGGVTAPAGEVAGNPASPETDASGTIPSGTPVTGATEPSTVPEAVPAPPVPVDADGNVRTDDGEGLTGTVDNSDGFLAGADAAAAQENVTGSDTTDR